MTPPRPTPRILIIAGSDSGGGAGIQADIKTVTMLGGHAMTAITAITAQNTLGVQAVHPVPTDIVIAQIDSCLSDIGVDAVKIGMIGSAATAHAVADRLEGLAVPIVFDPVMVATSGSVLADAETIAAFERLMRIARVVTPNLPELAALGGENAVLAHGCNLLVKGGHGDGENVIDRLLSPDREIVRWNDSWIATRSTHGTGCTLASAIATGLGAGLDQWPAIDRARLFVRMALRAAPGLGAGHGPLGQQDVRLDGILDSPILNQITLPTTQFAASEAFYRYLGLDQIVASEARYARFESQGGVTLSIEAADEIDGRPLIYFECDELEFVVSKMQSAGFDFGAVRTESWGWREARGYDPSGNAICLYQAGEMRRFPPWRLPGA